MPGLQCTGHSTHSPDLPSLIEAAEDPEPIAIIGIGCRLPGDVSSASECWQFLQAGKDARNEFPRSRFNIDAFYSSKNGTPGTLPMRGGYFLNQDIRQFDNGFFGINNLEATYMDPQQRNLLEVVYESLESAGVRLEDVAGSNVGCYVGDFVYDFLVMQGKDDESFHRYSPTGKGRTILSNRISHAFDFRGPSVTMDTACSSSLYCLHMACRALLQGDCDSAVVASANLIQTPEQQMDVAASGVLSPTSTCHTFDAAADGYGRADAVSALYLKRLSDAIRDNDPIRSIIRGTSINSDGQTPGITLPSGKAQVAVIKKAYEFARLSLRDTDFVICHGTGTPVGDPIEVSAVAQAHSSSYPQDANRQLLVGSVKPNFGHSEAASGITSIIKASLALEHLEIPATVGIQNLNPNIPWTDYNVAVVRQHTPWPQSSRRHIPRIGINSFGYGGANAHCILDQADAWIEQFLRVNRLEIDDESFHTLPVFPELDDEQSLLLPFSARDPTSLTKRIKSFANLKLPASELANLSYTLSTRRSTFKHRSFVVASGSSWSSNFKTAVDNTDTHNPNLSESPLTFIFTGQGAQWPQMGKRLFDAYTTFRNSILRTDYHLRSLPTSPSWSLIDLFLDSEGDRIDQPLLSQTMCTAVQIALVDLLRSWNIVPNSVVGHSSGEIAAAYAAGHISSTYAIEIAYLRGQVVSTNTAVGAMMAASMSPSEAQDLIDAHHLDGSVCVACHNSPENVTISGDAQAIDVLHGSLQERGRFSRILKTGNQAYHSHHMKKIGSRYELLLREAFQREDFEQEFLLKQPRTISKSTNVVMFSSVLDRPVYKSDTIKPGYWRANLESPVLFSPAVGNLINDQSQQIFIEIGPHHAMQMPVQQIESATGSAGRSPYLSALVRNKCSEATALSLAGNLWTYGHDIDFEAVRKGYRWASKAKPRVLHDLPNYPWNHSQILWKEPRASIEYRNRQFPRDELIGSRCPAMNGRTNTWRGILDIKNVPWLVDHKLGSNIVLPGACYISMASRACQQLLSNTNDVTVLELRDVRIEKVMLLKADSPLEVFTELRPLRLTSLDDYALAWEFIISSIEDSRTTRHASGCIEAFTSTKPRSIPDVRRGAHLELQSNKLWYSRFMQQSLAFGPTFQSLDSVSIPRQRDELIAEAALRCIPKDVRNEFEQFYPFDIHPIITDAAFQTGLIATAKGALEQLSGKVPVSIERLHIFRHDSVDASKDLEARASARLVGSGSAIGQCELVLSNGDIALQVQNVRVAALQETEITRILRTPIQKTVWIPDVLKVGRHNAEQFATVLSKSASNKASGTATHIASLLKFRAMLSADCQVLHVGEQDTISSVSMAALISQTKDFLHTDTIIGLLENSERILCKGLRDGKLPEVSELLSSGSLLDASTTQYDVIVLHDHSHSGHLEHINERVVAKHVKAGGLVVSVNGTTDDTGSDSGIFLDDASFSSEQALTSSSIDFKPDLITIDIPILEEPVRLTISLLKHEYEDKQGATVLIAANDVSHPLNIALLDKLRAVGFQTTINTFDNLTADLVQSKSIVIVTAELDEPIVTRADARQFAQIQLLANYASRVIWTTGSDRTSSKGPEYCGIIGLARSIMAGNPTSRFAVLQIDDPHSQIACSVANIRSVAQNIYQPGSDLEYLQKDGLLYVSRLLSEDDCNRDFEQKKYATSKLGKLSDIQDYELRIRDPGQFDTLEFRPSNSDLILLPDHVEVAVKAVGMNAKDLYTLSGKVDTVEDTCSCEFSGVITAIGSAVTGFAVGDRIVSSAPGRYRPLEKVPASVCYQLNDEEDFVQLASVPMVYATAIHALRNLANLQSGESVLIHSAAGGVGTAAILLAKSIGAQIYATVGNEKKKAYLVDQYDLNPDHIFNSRDTSFLPAILKATNDVGVDVVLNSLTGPRLHASLEACARFGRFIEIGKRDMLDGGSLNMSAFQKGITFSAFDLHELYYSNNPKHRHTYEKLLVDAVEFYRTLGYTGSATTSFDISDISSAFRYFANASRIGKVAITYDDPDAMVPAVAPKFKTRFSGTKSYLLIGCLGGLGRSISRYMLQSGARHFTFLGRSGIAKDAARLLVSDLERAGATVTVIKGDVCNMADVEAAVQALTHPLGGVIQAAMGLSEALFPVMTHSAWHTALDPKIRGTLNVHRAISSHEADLEFFLMTSSIAGTIGFSTEANYCTANNFLDHFASFRRNQGLKATSVALGPVAGAGIVHEHPEIENVFFRGGITEVSEDDMLCIIDIALSRQEEIGHLITGLEPARAKPGFEDSWEMLAPDPRLNHITAAHLRARSSATAGNAGSSQSNSTVDVRIIAALKEPTPASSLTEALHTVLAEQLAKLVLMEASKIDAQMYLADVGMDSTLAAQFRTYVFRSTGVDVSFVMLMDGKSRISDLVGYVRDALMKE